MTAVAGQIRAIARQNEEIKTEKAVNGNERGSISRILLVCLRTIIVLVYVAIKYSASIFCEHDILPLHPLQEQSGL